jgi:hypothetical protein
MQRPVAKSSPPKGRRHAEEDLVRDYWSSHDSTESVEWSGAVRASFPNLGPSTETISLRLPAGLLADLKILAQRIDVPYQSLMKVYLADRVRAELVAGVSSEPLELLVREPESPYGIAPAGTHRRKKRR